MNRNPLLALAPAALLAAVMFAASCSRQAPLSPADTPDDAVTTVDLSVLRHIEMALRPPVTEGADAERRGRVVYVPAGSDDALAGAIATAGAHGAVVLRAGVHHESGPVEIATPVTLFGETGAVLESHIPTWPVASPTIQAALWVHTPGFAMRGIEMRPEGGIGGTAILLDHAPGAAVFQNNLHDYQYGVLIEGSDRTRIFDNRISATPAWLSDPNVPEAHGIVNINGVGTIVARNTVTNALFGIWACDRNGLAFGNQTSGNLIGLILCKVPLGSYPLPGGAVAGAQFSATSWLAQSNVSFGNFATGLLIIDGANGNHVVSNDSHDNGGYAVEFTADTFRFGFLTPASFNNVFVAGAFPNIQVKDCGNGNRILGGKLVDNTLEPCD